MFRAAHLLNIKQHYALCDVIIHQIFHISHHAVVADNAVLDVRIIQPLVKRKVVKLEPRAPQFPQNHQPRKTTFVHKVGIETAFAHEHIAPFRVGRCIVISHQRRDFLHGQCAVRGLICFWQTTIRLVFSIDNKHIRSFKKLIVFLFSTFASSY